MRARTAVAVGVGVALLGGAGTWVALDGGSPAPPDDRPSIVLILTDDLRWDMMGPLPTVRRRIGGHGVTFPNGFVVNPVCCPSRASILTGGYSHNTGVYRNRSPDGGFSSFDDSDTIATRLQAAGYTTALVGKYLNGYGEAGREGYVPPGWDRWVGSVETRYYGYALNVDGDVVEHGNRPEDYSTDVLSEHAVRFIAEAEGPLFLHLSTWAPHPMGVAAPGDEGTFDGIAPWRPPSFGETDVSDKPEWVRRLPPLEGEALARNDERRVSMLETLPALDRAVGRILDALAASGRLSNTLVVFASDNGFSWGEHRWTNKQTPYEQDIRVPFLVRFDPLVEGPATDPRMVLNIDLAPTFAELAGVDLPGADGRSLLPLLSGPGPDVPWREDFLIEHLIGDFPRVPSYCAVRGIDEKYVLYETGEEELYDLAADPHELENLAGDPAQADRLARLRARLLELCRPPPPGMSLPPA